MRTMQWAIYAFILYQSISNLTLITYIYIILITYFTYVIITFITYIIIIWI
jgi:hypothetical protein